MCHILPEYEIDQIIKKVSNLNNIPKSWLICSKVTANLPIQVINEKFYG
jgi:hypothetical protein